MPFLKRIEIVNEESSKVYPYNISSFYHGQFLELDEAVTFFVGENGTGKSTLIESIADNIGFNKLGGTHNHNYENKDDSPSLKLRMAWLPRVNNGMFIRSESFYSFTSHLDEIGSSFGQTKEFEDKLMNQRSHGEAFISLLSSLRPYKNSIYLLDEPESALSPRRQLSLLAIIHNLVKSGKCQFIIATHSPIILSYPDASIFEIIDDEILSKNYKDLDHVKFTNQFLNNPELFLKHLLV